jgi:hypothetical protein
VYYGGAVSAALRLIVLNRFDEPRASEGSKEKAKPQSKTGTYLHVPVFYVYHDKDWPRVKSY